MIILDDKEIAFIHVPKCAGSTIRHQLLAMSNQEDVFKGPAVLPELGKVHLPHLTLAQVQVAYPEVLQKIATYDSFAVIRDPMQRFTSALSQRLKQHKHVDIYTLDADGLRQEMNAVFEVLAESKGALPSEFVHFTRQSDFVELDGKQIVKNLFAIEDVAKLVSVIGERYGVKAADPGRHNQTLEFRHAGLRDTALKVNQSLKAVVPRSAYVRLKSMITPLLTKKPNSGEKRLPFTDDEIRRLKEYYASDFKYKNLANNRIARRDEENA